MRTPVALLCVLTVSAGSASAQPCVFPPSGEITVPPGVVTPIFGSDLAVDGDRLAVGAPGADGTGAVFVFERQGGAWIETAKLTAPDGAAGDSFGEVLDLDGDRLAVVATGADVAGAADKGAVYVFDRIDGAWTYQKKLWASDAPTMSGFFAYDVSLEGDVLVVSAPARAYVFERLGPGWFETQRIEYPGSGWLDHDLEDGLLAITPTNSAADGYRKIGTTWTKVVDYPEVGPGGTYRVTLNAGRIALGGGKVVVADANTGSTLNELAMQSHWIALEGDRLAVANASAARVLRLHPNDTGVDDVVQLAVPNGSAPQCVRFHEGAVLGRGKASAGAGNSIYSFATTPFAHVAPGCPGSGGFVPRLELGFCSVPGSTVLVSLANGLGGSTALLFMGTELQNLPFGAGCAFSVGGVALPPIGFPLFGAGPGNGNFQFSGPIPLGTPHVEIVFQALVRDPGLPFGACASNTIRMIVP